MSSPFLPLSLCVLFAFGMVFSRRAAGDVMTNHPAADTTVFEAFPTNNLGAGDLTSGSTAASLRSRALIKFGLDGAIHSGATVRSVVLILTATRQPPDGTSSNYRLFRVQRPWVEGGKTGVHGAPADPGTTTWSERLASEPDGQWSVPGGGAPIDFSQTASATAALDGENSLRFTSTPALVADVQFWLENPSSNFGWVLTSDAEDVPQTVTHFASREDPTNAPELVIEYAPVSTAEPPEISGFGRVNGRFTLEVNAKAETSYTIQYLPTLREANWQTLMEIGPVGIDTNVVVLDLLSSPQRFYRVRENLRPNLVFVPPGTFVLGSPSDEVDRFANEGPQTKVTFRQGFWVGRFSVTQREYTAVIGTNPSFASGDPNLPVERVSWFDATNYCYQLTQKEKGAGLIPANFSYRLPTEAEWECACRASTTTRFSYGDDPGYTQLSQYAWYADNSDSMSHPVGQKRPNPWGLYDMHGDILNWCQDWWGAYPGGSVLDPGGPASGSARVIRGGAWLRIAGHCRSAFRHSFTPETQNILIGFRVVLAPTSL